MDSTGSAAFLSWAIDARLVFLLILTAAVYTRGWLRGRRVLREEQDCARLGAFVGGLLVLFVALESPLDSFDTLLLSAHMTQHLLLMMVAPPLLLLGHPALPFLRGLPKRFVKEGLGPFLTWPWLRRVLHFLTYPTVAWLLYTLSTIVWHVPALYELVLRSAFWHGAQHACFFWTGILFWWPVVEPGPGRPPWPRWAMIPYLLLADITNTALSAFFIFSGQILYPSYEAVRVNGFSARDDQAAAGAIMWVPGSMVYLVPAIVIAVRLFSGSRSVSNAVRVRRTVRVGERRLGNRRLAPRLRRGAQALMLVLTLVVMADGFWGTQVAPLNLAGVLPWIHWRAFSVFALLVVGNLFCMVCPFTFVRDMARRVVPPRWRWPRWLRSKWLAGVLLILYLWAYEAFSLWDKPFATAWIIAGYFLAALVVDVSFRGASFCKYVCPIGQFHFVSSLVSPREVSVRSQAVCQTCRTYDCIRGNERDRGCELQLFQPRKVSNLDCTFCLDCVKACPHDNVALLPVLPASTLLADPHRSSIGRLSKRTDLAWVAILIVFGAFVNAAGMVSPVMMWEHGWHARLGPWMMPWIVGGFVVLGVIVAPLGLVALCGAVNRLSGVVRWRELARRLVFALVPLGVAMWAAHLLFHFSAYWMPSWLMPSQIVLLDAGLLVTLYVGWRVSLQYGVTMRRAAGVMTPWAALSCALYGCGIWILFQPMEMRGMLP